jgi:hypothetical protein
MVAAIGSPYIQRQGDPTPAEMGYPGVWENKGVHNFSLNDDWSYKERILREAEAEKNGMSLNELYAPIPATLWQRKA